MSGNLCPGEPGDLLVFKRSLGYDHYAVNVGDGYIIHATSMSKGTGSLDVLGSCSGSSKIAAIKKEKYRVTPGNEVHVEGTWKGRKPLPVDEIIKRAESKVGIRDYSVLFNNCEHFARWCRYDEKSSDQADGLKMMAAGATGAALFLGGLTYAVSRPEKRQ
jgi:hypothetical protein